jgi:diadenosine tetraphosphate (Ap4A) HIT family hydrolase
MRSLRLLMLRIHTLVHDQVQHYGALQLLQQSIEDSIPEQARNILNIAALMDARNILMRVMQITGSPHHLHIRAIPFHHYQSTSKGLFWQRLLPQVCIGPTLSVLQD